MDAELDHERAVGGVGAVELAMRACMASAARTASAGSPNEAITASPIVLTTAPSWSRTIEARKAKCSRTMLKAAASPTRS